MSLFKKKDKNKTKKSKNKDIGKKKVKKTKKNKEGSLKLNNTVQKTIPYLEIDQQTSIMKVDDKHYSKTYLLEDVNFQTAKVSDQYSIYDNFCQFLNSFDTEVNFEITVFSRYVQHGYLETNAFMRVNGDGLDGYREEMNDFLKRRMKEGQNNLLKDKYLSVTVEADDYNEALRKLTDAENTFIDTLKRISGASGYGATALTAEERLEILYDIYNRGNEGGFSNTTNVNGKEVSNFSFDNMEKLGLTTKDIVGPVAFEFDRNYGIIGEGEYFQSLYIKDLPNRISPKLFRDLTSLPFKQLTSIHNNPESPYVATKAARNQITNIRANLLQSQKKAARDNYSADLVNMGMQEQHEEASRIYDRLTRDDEKLFQTTIVITHFADSLEDLESQTESIKNVARKSVVNVNVLSLQQEQALNSSLPIGRNDLYIKRAFLTKPLAAFLPFDSAELSHRQGIFYGQNTISNNMIRINKKQLSNQNSFIFGTPGSGKSMTAKWEIANVALSTNDDIMIIDPEGEYAGLVAMLGGETIPLSVDSPYHMNPLDISLHYGDNDRDDGVQFGQEYDSDKTRTKRLTDPIPMKSSFIFSFLQQLLNIRLEANEKGMIDKALKEVYADYFRYLAEFERGGKHEHMKPDISKAPTLKDLQDAITNAGSDPQFNNISNAITSRMELYTSGSQNYFAHTTNIDVKNRIVNYDISSMTDDLKDVTVFTVLDSIWNRIVENRRLHKRTWIYIDEVHILFASDDSAKFLNTIYKRARKWGGLPTGITQNVDDVLKSPYARPIIANCTMITILNQKSSDRDELADILQLSPTQLGHITNSRPGNGLIYVEEKTVPFKNEIPKDLGIYDIITTRPEEVEAQKSNINTDED